MIKIDKGTFYRSFPSETDTAETNPAFFPKLSFALPEKHGDDGKPQYWAVLSSSSLARTAFLQVLASQHICIPPTARTYPLLSDLRVSTHHGIKYIGFDADRGSSVSGTNVRGAYLSARYESRREETDYTVQDYLTGHTELNALEHSLSESERQKLNEVISQLNLRTLLSMPVANLSNGQTRRARIAKALVSAPELLLLDGPFMGLDPNTARNMGSLMQNLAERQSPRLIMSLRPEDVVPDWITHLLVADDALNVIVQGQKQHVLAHQHVRELVASHALEQSQASSASQDHRISRDGWKADSPASSPGEAVVEMQGVKVSYGDKTVLGDWKQPVEGMRGSQDGLWWSLHRGQRCGIFGANGSGKTTMLSLITSDHPQTYSLPIKLFGRSRLPGPGEPGISLFDIQRRMGHSSPEVHAFFPKNLTVRRALESAWADAPMSKPKLTAQNNQKVDAVLRWFARDLHPSYEGSTYFEQLAQHSDKTSVESTGQGIQHQQQYQTLEATDLTWAKEIRFRDLSFSSQRLILFLRALVAEPDLVILDEALSGIDERVRDKALIYLSHGEKADPESPDKESILQKAGKVTFAGLSADQALLVISHSPDDVPGCVRQWICLQEPGERRPPRIGTLPGPLELHPKAWSEGIWGAGS